MVGRLPALVQFLQNDPAVSAVVGARVWADEIPDNMIGRMPIPSILVTAAGGTNAPLRDGYYSSARVDVRCYAYTPSSARDVEQTVYMTLSLMQSVVVGQTLLHWCRPSGGPHQMREPGGSWPGGFPDNTVNWPFVLRSWQVLSADVAAA